MSWETGWWGSDVQPRHGTGQMTFGFGWAPPEVGGGAVPDRCRCRLSKAGRGVRAGGVAGSSVRPGSTEPPFPVSSSGTLFSASGGACPHRSGSPASFHHSWFVEF